MTFAIGEIVEIVGYGQAGAFIGSNVQLPKFRPVRYMVKRELEQWTIRGTRRGSCETNREI